MNAMSDLATVPVTAARRRAAATLAVAGLGHAGVYALLVSLAERAGLAHFTPHDLRRTYAGDMLDCGVDLKTVQDLMGHATPITTARYDRRGVRAKVDAAARLDAKMRRAG